MNFLSKTALGLLAAAGVMTFTAPKAEARHYSHHYSHHYSRGHYGGGYYSGYRGYYGPRRVVVYRDYDPYYSYGYYRPYYYGGPSFSIGFGGHRGWSGHGHHHHR